MNQTFLRAFSDEIEKIAVTTQQLAAGAKRIKGVMSTDPLGMVRAIREHGIQRAGGAAALQMAHSGANKNILNLASSSSVPTLAQQKALRGAKRRALGVPRDTYLIDLDPTISIQRDAAGMIINAGPATVGRMRGIKGKAGRQAFSNAALMHEQAERAVRGRDMDIPMTIRRGHRSLDVLMKERNLRQNLKGEGSGEALAAFRRLRDGSGDDTYLRETLRSRYGPRADQFLVSGKKIPKAMRKDVLRALRRSNPGYRKDAEGLLTI